MVLTEVKINAVRENVLAIIKGNEDKYDSRDIYRVINEDWFVERFMRGHKTADSAANALNEALLWRNENGVNDVRRRDVPKEYRDLGITHIGKDKDGVCVVYLRVKYFLPVDGWIEFVMKVCITFFNDYADSENAPGIALVLDLNGAGTRNFDMNFGLKTMTMLKHYPVGLKYIWYCESPFYLKPLVAVLLPLFPAMFQDIVKVVKREEAIEIMGEDYLPPFLGGKGLAMLDFTFPPDAIGFREMGKRRGFSENRIKKFEDYLNNNLKMLANE